jgi:3-phosphoshikimate 1-carboxyvinyltransferase
MKIFISKSDIAGTVRAPSSKSYTIRALMCGALAQGRSDVIWPLASDDTDAARRVLERLGVRFETKADSLTLEGGQFRAPIGDLHCGDSAATLRFMSAICSVVPGRCRLVAGPSLSNRPVKVLVDALRQLGVRIESRGDYPPVTVEGGTLIGGLTELPGDVSSQFISGLLLAAPFAEKEVTIRLTTPAQSRPYLLMTVQCLKSFGVNVDYSQDLQEFHIARQSYHAARYEVEGDWSSASYLIALGAACGRIRVDNLKPDSLQGDRAIAGFLREMGACVDSTGNAIASSRAQLHAIKADLSDCIDLLPTVAVLASLAEETSEFTGIARARIKESNRVQAIRKGLEGMGTLVYEDHDRLSIVGGSPAGATIDSCNDHRIAMSFSIAGCAVGNTTIDGAESVSKTFPDYWDMLKSVGGSIRTDG